MSAPAIDIYTPAAGKVSIHGRHFVDNHGRVLQLRGANVGSASKVPASPTPKIDQAASATYVNRPFPLEAAPEHWARLKSWGLTFLRINVTWDAVEHAGPGQYDVEYLAYLRKLLESLRGAGLVAYVSIHQDVWSRYTGGSGAPAWTLEMAGFDLSGDGAKLEASGAAYLGGVRGGRVVGERGLWPTGYQKLACATMNTLFWGGETFAPSLKVGEKGINIQTFLQDAFLAAYEQIVDAVGDLETVMGFEMMNEPHSGYIGLSTVDEWNYNTDLHLGQFPSPLQSFALGAGHPTMVPRYERSFPFPTRLKEHVLGNSDGVCVWSESGPTGGKCPWEQEGVWMWSEGKKAGVALAQDYFAKTRNGRSIEFYADFYYLYIRKWEAMINAKQPTKAALIEALPNEYCPVWPLDARPRNFVYAPHWYDLNTMFTKKFGTMTVNVQGLSRGMFLPRALYFGRQVKDNYALQIRTLVTEARRKLGEVPVVFGECGIPMDMNHEEAFTSGDWRWHERMMDALISAMEASLVHFNLWAYNPLNTDALGDDWNSENFSWFSEAAREVAVRDGKAEAKDLDAGGRLLDVIVRPYAVATAGQPLSSTYERTTALFTHRFRDTPQPLPASGVLPPARVTEIFLPRRVYPRNGGVKWSATKGGRVEFDYERQRLFLWFVDDAGAIGAGKEVHRRVDIWMREPADDDQLRSLTIGMIGMLFIVALVVANELKYHFTGAPWVYLHW